MTDRSVLRSDAAPDHKLGSPAVHVLCGCAFVFLAWGFSYLDRRFGNFGFEAALWAGWALIGFSAGAVNLARETARARKLSTLLLVIAGVLAWPGFLMFSLTRWAAFVLLLVTAARAPAMRTRRDFYYCLAPIFAVSLLVPTHGTADWTVWFYLGPAWLFIALALAWDYAAGVELGRLLKTGMTLAFIAVCLVLSVALFAAMPRPNMLGFGFLPPGTDAPGRFTLEAGAAGDSGRSGEAGRRGPGAAASGPATGQEQSPLAEALDRMRQALKDPALPGWQHGVIQGLLAAGEALMQAGDRGAVLTMTRPMTAEERAAFASRVATVLAVLQWLVLLLLLALIAATAWLLRWHIALAGALWAAWALARWEPAASMRCSAHAMRWLLRRAGHPIQPGHSVMEHAESAAFLPALPRRWLRTAARLYCDHRFGAAPASSEDASGMRQAIVATLELLRAAPPRLQGQR
jgi:hypothetical protein